jgi:hypothetical protein
MRTHGGVGEIYGFEAFFGGPIAAVGVRVVAFGEFLVAGADFVEGDGPVEA